MPGGQSGAQGSTTYGGGYGSGPLDLPAGSYSITAWLATNAVASWARPRNECSTQVALRPLETWLNADYPTNQACTFQPAPSPSPGYYGPTFGIGLPSRRCTTPDRAHPAGPDTFRRSRLRPSHSAGFHRVSAAGWASVIVSGLLHHGLAYVFYLAALRRINASSAAVSFDLVPIFGIAAGLVYGERLDAPQWVSAAVVIGAVALIAWRKNKGGGSRAGAGRRQAVRLTSA